MTYHPRFHLTLAWLLSAGACLIFKRAHPPPFLTIFSTPFSQRVNPRADDDRRPYDRIRSSSLPKLASIIQVYRARLHIHSSPSPRPNPPHALAHIFSAFLEALSPPLGGFLLSCCSSLPLLSPSLSSKPHPSLTNSHNVCRRVARRHRPCRR